VLGEQAVPLLDLVALGDVAPGAADAVADPHRPDVDASLRAPLPTAKA
jgi:hypothetical protein